MRAVDGAVGLGGGARVVDADAVARDRDGDLVVERLLQPVGLERVGVGAVGQLGDGRAHRPLAAPRISSANASRSSRPYSAISSPSRRSSRSSPVICAHRSPSVWSGVRTAARSSLISVASGLPSIEQLHYGDVEALLEHLARLDRAHLAADVGRVRGGGGEGHDPALAEDRLGDGDVVEVPGGDPGRIGDQHVAGPHVVEADLLDELLHRDGQRADEGGDALRVLRQRLPGRVGQHAGEVVGLVHQRRERRAPQRLRRLVDGGDGAAPEDLQRDGVEGVV